MPFNALEEDRQMVDVLIARARAAALSDGGTVLDDVSKRLNELEQRDRNALLRRLAFLTEALVHAAPKCHVCGQPATCFGSYEQSDKLFACDTCCGHGNEDGHCERLPVP